MSGSPGPLAPYRVLDLTDAGGYLCGKILADLGADVLLIEPPDGSSGRRIPPFPLRIAECGLRTEESQVPSQARNPHSAIDGGFFFRALNVNKRGLTLDLEGAAGKRRLERLVEGADFLVESLPVGRLAALGFSAERLLAINPRLVVVSISPFGQRGPYSRYAGSDLVIAALSGLLLLTGEPDRPPVRVAPVYQTHFHAGAEAAVAALVAHHQRLCTGRGVVVDVPAMLAAAWATMTAILSVALEGVEPRRAGTARRRAGVLMPAVFACADGHVVLDILGGHIGAASNRALWRWMAEEGMASPDLLTKDWENWDFAAFADDPAAGQREVDRVCGEAARFLLRHTKGELFDRAVRDGILLAPANTAADLLASPQLAARRYFWRHPDPALGEAVYAGPFARLSATPIVFRRPAPALRPGSGDTDWQAARHSDGPGPFAAPDPGPRPPDRGPFAGLKVADFAWVAAGPTITRYLATYGATVVRVESRARPDPLRTMHPFAGGQPGLNRAGHFARVNAGKRSLALNLDTATGQALARRLVDWADVVVESFTPGTMAKWGLDYATLARERPGLVMVSSCMLGQDGPYAAYRGFGALAAAMCGFNEASGWPDRGPGAPFGAYTDTIGPRFAAAALLAALDHRRRTGRGQHIDLSQLEASVHFLGASLLEYAVNGQDVVRRGNRARAAAPHGVYPVAGADAWLAIACRDEADWAALRRVLGDPVWAARPEFADLAGRLAHGDALDEALAGATRAWDGSALMAALQAEGVPAGVVQGARALLKDPQIAALGYLHWLDHPAMGRVPYEGSCFLLDGAAAPLSRSPLLGEHTEEVLRDLLGLDDEAIARAVLDGAVDL